MTTTKLSVMDRLLDDNPDASRHIREAITMLGMSTIAIQNPTTAFDYNRAVEVLLDGLQPMTPGLLDGLPVPSRQPSADVRPLYHRLNDEDRHVVKIIRKYLDRLALCAVLIDREDTRHDYIRAVKAFSAALQGH